MPWLISSLFLGRPGHPTPRRHHMLAIPHRHPDRLPPSVAHDRRQIHIQRQQILRRPDPHGVPADALDLLGRQLEVAGDRLECPGDGFWTQPAANSPFPLAVVSRCSAPNNTPEHGSLFDSG